MTPLSHLLPPLPGFTMLSRPCAPCARSGGPGGRSGGQGARAGQRPRRNGLTAALARLGRAFMARDSWFPGVHEMRRNMSQG